MGMAFGILGLITFLSLFGNGWALTVNSQLKKENKALKEALKLKD